MSQLFSLFSRLYLQWSATVDVFLAEVPVLDKTTKDT